MRFLNLSTYSSPKIVEQKNKDWVFYGDDNNYYQYLIDLYHGSPTNNACVKGIADLIFGEGLEAVKADRNLQGYIEVKKLFSDDCLRKIAMDLKMLGQASFQIVKTKNRKSVYKAYHFPIQTLRPKKANKDGEIDGYYYSADWTQATKKGFEPEFYPAFGYEGNAEICFYVIKPYSTGNFYFSPVDYQGGLQYCELETEIGNYHLNNIKLGLAPSMLINFHNGIPPEEEQDAIESDITRKFTGSSNSGRFILAFNDSKEHSATIEPVQLSDAHEQYQFLSDESMRKVMVAHRITSPMLLGIKDQTGLGNNADELKTASTLFDNVVIKPFQRLILNAIDDILAYNGVSLDLYFKTLQPLEFTDYSGKPVDEETIEKETNVTFSKDCGCKDEFKDDDDPCWEGYEMIGWKTKNGKKVPNCVPINAKQEMSEHPQFNDEDEEAWLMHLSDKGETIDDEEWELMEEVPVTDYEEDDNRYEFFKKYAEPQDKSNQDRGLFKVRYAYAPKAASTKSRGFCKQMVDLSKKGVVYRKEDIVTMGKEGVNGQFAPKGSSTYSIWMWKGGVNCHHYWTRKVYFRKRGSDGRFLPKSETDKLENEKSVSVARAVTEGMPLVPNNPLVSTKPINTPTKGKLN